MSLESFCNRVEKNLLLKVENRQLLLSVFCFIEAHYHDSISLRQVADAVNRSPAYLTDLVRRETGKTVLSWIIERRMAEARYLLLATVYPLEQITEAVGYQDTRHFTRLFRRFHKMPPQAWRRVHRGSNIPTEYATIARQEAKSEL